MERVAHSLSYVCSFGLRIGPRQRLDRRTASPEFCMNMKMTAKAGNEHFQSGAEKYAAYLETPEGRLRCKDRQRT